MGAPTIENSTGADAWAGAAVEGDAGSGATAGFGALGVCAGWTATWPAGLLATPLASPLASNETKPRPADTGAAGRAGAGAGVGVGVGAGTGLAGTSTLACCLGNVKGARLGSGPSGSAAVGSVIVEAGEGAAGIVAKGTCGSSTGIAAITTGSGLPLWAVTGVGIGSGGRVLGGVGSGA